MLFLVAGHNNNDPGNVSRGTKEADLTQEIRDLVAKEMKALGLKFKIDDDELSLGETFRWIKQHSKPKDVVVDLHFNSGLPTLSGCESIVPLNSSAIEQEVGKTLSNITATELGIPDRGCKDEKHTPPGHAMMSLECESVLLEVCFMTNPTEIQNYQSKKASLAKALAKALGTWTK